MKKHLLSATLLTLLIMSACFQQGMAQGKKSSKVRITITEDDKVTSDTTFELKEGQDPEMIKKAVSHMTGSDMKMVHVSKEAHMSHEGDKKMVWVSSDGEHVWHGEKEMSGINLDSIREAHQGAKVLVVKKKDGEVTVKELDDDEDLHFGDEEADFHTMMFVESDDEGKTIHIKKEKTGQKIIMISEAGDEESEYRVIVKSDADQGDCKEKTVKVIVSGDDDMECLQKGEEGEDVKVTKKKVRVEIEEDDAGAGAAAEKPEKKKQK